MANVAVCGIYKDRVNVENAVDTLRRQGFRNTDISVLFPDFAVPKNTKAPEGAAAGVGAGAIVGDGLGWLAGFGMLAIPGIGPFIAAGPIMTLLAGVGVGGAVGSIMAALVGMGIPEGEARRYEGRIKAGGILLSVHGNTLRRIKRAGDLLKATGAEDIAAGSEWETVTVTVTAST